MRTNRTKPGEGAEVVRLDRFRKKYPRAKIRATRRVKGPPGAG